MAKQKINPLQVNPGITMISVAGTTVNPISTTETDVPNSSRTFTLDRASTAHITVHSTIQNNTTTQAMLKCHIDGSEQVRLRLTVQGDGTGNVRWTCSSTYQVPLSAGEHTIKLRALAGTGNAQVTYDPTWNALIIGDN